MGERGVACEFAGAPAVLTSEFAPLMEYAALHLAPLCAHSGAAPVVQATLRWHEGRPPRDPLEGDPSLAALERVDRDLYCGQGALAWFRIDDFPDLHVRFAWDGRRLRVSGDYYYHLSNTAFRDGARRLIYRGRLRSLRERRFTTLLYYLLYYPCFWWLERQRDFHPIHAAGVELDGGVLVLAGPSGVGKSTLAAALAALPGARLLSDTFLLHRGTEIRPVREPLLLDAWSCGWLGDAADLLEPIAWRYCLERTGFHWPVRRLSDGGRARLLVLPRRAAQRFARPVEAAEAHGRISAADSVIKDLRRYWAFAAVLEMLDPSPLMAARERSLGELVEQVPCLALGLTEEMTRREATELISSLAVRGVAEGGARVGGHATSGAG